MTEPEGPSDWFTEWPNSIPSLGLDASRSRPGDAVTFQWDGRHLNRGFQIARSPTQTDAAKLYRRPRPRWAGGGQHPSARLFALAAVEGLDRTGEALMMFDYDMGKLMEELGHALCSGLVLGEELPIWRAFGPYGQPVPAFIEYVQGLTADQATSLADHFRAHPLVGERWRFPLGPIHERRESLVALLGATSLQWHAPASAWCNDEEAIDKGQQWLVDVGWQRLSTVVSEYATALILPDVLTTERVQVAIEQWHEAVALIDGVHDMGSTPRARYAADLG